MTTDEKEHQLAMEALVRLVEVALGYSGQSYHLKRFLLGIYNPEVWPFELNRLKCLDESLAHDCLRVLSYNTFKASREMHEFLEGGDSLLKDFWRQERDERDG